MATVLAFSEELDSQQKPNTFPAKMALVTGGASYVELAVANLGLEPEQAAYDYPDPSLATDAECSCLEPKQSPRDDFAPVKQEGRHNYPDPSLAFNCELDCLYESEDSVYEYPGDLFVAPI